MSRAKKWLCPLLMAVLLIWTGHMVLREQSPSQLLSALSRVQPLFLLSGFGIMLVFLACEAGCTHLILRTLGTPAPYRRCLGYAATGFYFSTVTPSSTGGQPAQVYAMRQDGIPAAHGTLDMLLVTICYQAVTALFALVAWLCFPELVSRLGQGLSFLLLTGMSINLSLTAVMVLFLVRPQWSAGLAKGCITLLVGLHLMKNPARWRQALDRQMARYAEGGQVLRAKPSLLPRLLGLSAVQVGVLYLVPWTVYLALGLSGHSPLELLALQALMTISVGFLPLPGAAGASEAAFLQGFTTLFGGLVTPGMVLSRGISCYGMLILTGLFTLTRSLLHKRRPRDDVSVRRRAVRSPYVNPYKAA